MYCIMGGLAEGTPLLESRALSTAQREDTLSLKDELAQLKESFDRIEPVIPITTTILSEALEKPIEPPADIDRARKFLGSALGLVALEDDTTARQIMEEAFDSYNQVSQWLTITDFGITPLHLRMYLEKHPMEDRDLRALIKYYLAKSPRAHNDRDKLDYLLLEYFMDKVKLTDVPNLEVLLEIEEQFEPLMPSIELPEPSSKIELRLSELYGLRAHLAEFTDLDKLIQSRLVERARALKLQLGEAYFHPSILPRVVHFNLDFRRRFDRLFKSQVKAVQKASLSRIEEAWEIIRSIEEAYERLEFPELYRKGAGMPASSSTMDLIVGRKLLLQNERIPLERLQRGEAALRKDADLQGIIGRIAKYVGENAAPDDKSGTVINFRMAHLDISAEEREAFGPTDGNAPKAAEAVQLGLGLIAWMAEEGALYQDEIDDRYNRKPHFDMVSHAVAQSIEFLHNVRASIKEDAEEGEAAWFGPLVKISLRLGESMNHALHVFESEERTENTDEGTAETPPEPA